MMMKISKIGMIISLVMVIHSLFLPNKFSLIIAIIGYILALASAVAYGLCKFSTTPQKVQHENLVEEEISEYIENTVNIIPKLSFFIPKSVQWPLISCAKISNSYPENIIDKIILENPNLNSNELETIEEIKDIGFAEQNKEERLRWHIPGYE